MSLYHNTTEYINFNKWPVSYINKSQEKSVHCNGLWCDIISSHCNVEEDICLRMINRKYVLKGAPSWQSENRTLIDSVHIADNW